MITRDEERINEAINKLKTALEELTVDSGETMNISGMTVRMERAKGGCSIPEENCGQPYFTTYGVTKTAVTPATGDLMHAREESKVLEDQCKIMSLNATPSKRTYPEISFAAVYLSSRYNKAMEDDWCGGFSWLHRSRGRCNRVVAQTVTYTGRDVIAFYVTARPVTQIREVSFESLHTNSRPFTSCDWRSATPVDLHIGGCAIVP